MQNLKSLIIIFLENSLFIASIVTSKNYLSRNELNVYVGDPISSYTKIIGDNELISFHFEMDGYNVYCKSIETKNILNYSKLPDTKFLVVVMNFFMFIIVFISYLLMTKKGAYRMIETVILIISVLFTALSVYLTCPPSLKANEIQIRYSNESVLKNIFPGPQKRKFSLNENIKYVNITASTDKNDNLILFSPDSSFKNLFDVDVNKNKRIQIESPLSPRDEMVMGRYLLIVFSASIKKHAIEKAELLRKSGYDAQVGKTKSNMYGVFIGPHSKTECNKIKDQLIVNGLAQRDSYLSPGEQFVETVEF